MSTEILCTLALECSLATAEEVAAPFFDTRVPFEEWLLPLEADTPTKTGEVVDCSDETFLIEGFEASHCDIDFDGMLKADGALKGNILSAHGTLLMTARGQVQADVDVRVAIIDGYLEGNLRATEHVVLKSNARVAGDIHMPSLSIRDGADLEGNSFFLEPRIYSEICKAETDVEASLAMTVGA